MSIVVRPEYMEFLTRELPNDVVRILTGVRRCGKSTLLAMYREWLVGNGVDDDRILSINFEDFANDHLRDPQKFHSFVEERNPEFLHVDEVQELEDWARVINSLRSRGTMQICVTGSNSSLFAGQGLTYLSGRYVELQVFPLSLREFREFRSDGGPPEASYGELMRIGSFPAVATSGMAADINKALFDSIFSRDIIMTGEVRDPAVFLRVARFVYDNAGNPLSANKIAATLSSEGAKVSQPTVEKYLRLMTAAHLVYECQPFDVRGRDILRGRSKYYWVDPGLRTSLLGSRTGNVGHDLENMVFLELKRRSYDVTTGVTSRAEIDFQVVRGEERVFVQVAWETGAEETLARELSAFKGLPAGAQCVLITADRVPPATGDVRHLDAFDFLGGAQL